MVVRMMRWTPWPPLSSRKIEVAISLRRLEGLAVPESAEKALAVEIKWKGQKGIALSSLRRSARRNFTKDGIVGDDGVVEWDEEFRNVCNFLGNKEGLFPWEVVLTVFNDLNRGSSSKSRLVGTASLNLAGFALTAEGKKLEMNVPLVIPVGSVECRPFLCLSLSFLELQTAHEPSETVYRSMVRFPLSPCYAPFSAEKDGSSSLKAGLRRVKNFRDYVSSRKAKKACHEEESSDGWSSVRSEDAEFTSPVDTDSLDDDADGESEESKEPSIVQRSLSYETLASAKCVGGLIYLNTPISNEDEALVYYSNSKSDVGCLYPEDLVCKQSLKQSSKRRILSWRRRKLGFKSPKVKGEPLLKKDNGEDGGDDIDFYRRQISSSDDSSYGWHKSEDGSTTSRSSFSEFGDDHFAIGSWEQKEVISRDGQMKLQTQVFYASIDQRSERAAGESACTALVAVIADWLLCNKNEMPIKSELDSLIRDGSLEWRNLCEDESYKERFPDRHFDLETILQAKIRPLSVVPEKSFIGFFHPEEGLKEDCGLDFLHGAMSFDNIWDEISRLDCLSNGVSIPLVYIVSWNDHFFVLRVEKDAYYIIDTLGERLFEGCNKAYVLKFDKDTTIHRSPTEKKASEDKSTKETVRGGTLEASSNEPGDSNKEDKDNEAVACKGKESCKEYIKSFLAAIPIRELQADMKKGLKASSAHLHRRLQIEFHYTQFLQPVAE